MSQTGGNSVKSPEGKPWSSHAEQNLTGCAYESLDMSSKIPVPINRKSNCPSRAALCQQGPGSTNPRSGSKSESDDKELICMIKIKAISDSCEETNGKKSVSLNTADKTNSEGEKVLKTKKCTCKSTQKTKAEPFVPLSEIETTYFEHYVEELQYSSIGVQTDLLNGSDSVDSLPALPEVEWCENGTEMPWPKIVLPPPAKYTIRTSKQEVKFLIGFIYVCKF